MVYYFLYLEKYQNKNLIIFTLIEKEHALLKSVKNINDFNRFMELNRDTLYANAENADNITLDDEWMQDNQWDEIYIQMEKQDGKI